MKIKRTVLLILIALTVCLIWGQSCLPVAVSQKESQLVKDHVVQPIQEKLTGKKTVTFDVRKTAHTVEYVPLGLELILLLLLRERRLNALLSALSVSGLTALLDESIQILSGRGPMISDVWLDIAGAVIGMAVGGAVLWIVSVIKKKRG